MKIKCSAQDLPMFNKFFPYLQNTSEQGPSESLFGDSFLKLPGVNNFSPFPIFPGGFFFPIWK